MRLRLGSWRPARTVPLSAASAHFQEAVRLEPITPAPGNIERVTRR